MQGFDAISYLGIWHEKAAIPKPYESAASARNLPGEAIAPCSSAMALYSLNKRGNKFVIQNFCISQGEIVNYISGKATSDPNCLSKLAVTFKDCKDRVFQGTYWVIATDYLEYSIVSNREKDSLWILSRNQLHNDEYKAFIEATCLDYGLDSFKLVWR